MSVTMKQLTEEGCSFSHYDVLGKIIYKSALVLWGPHTGTWMTQPKRNGGVVLKRMKLMSRTTYSKHVKLSVCFTKEEAEFAHMSLGDNRYSDPMHRKAIFALGYNKALAKVPTWALTEIRKWDLAHRMLISRFLYHTGPEGIRLLTPQDCSYFIGLFRLLEELHRPARIKLMLGTDKRSRLLRKVFPRITAVARNMIHDNLNTANTMHMALQVAPVIYEVAPEEDEELDIFPKLARKVKKIKRKNFTHNWHDNVGTIYKYGLKPRKNTYMPVRVIHRFDRRDILHENKQYDICWNWPGLEFQRRLTGDRFYGIFIANDEPATAQFYPLALQARTHEQMNRIHARMVEVQRQENRQRRDNYEEWCLKQNQDLLTKPWPEWKGPALIDGITHLNSVEALAIEGNEMHHCVSGYNVLVFNGTCTIFGIKYKDQRATLELDSNRNVNQLRGFANSEVTPELKKFVADWLKS